MIQKVNTTQVCALYDAVVRDGVLRDHNLLDGAVNAPFLGTFDMEFYPTLAQKAGKLLDGIQRVQAYTDGNKRLAWHSTLLFLQLNGQTIRPMPPEHVNTFVRSLAGAKGAELIAATWVNSRMIGLA